MNNLGLSKREVERIERQAYIEQEYINDVWNYDNEFRMNTYSCEYDWEKRKKRSNKYCDDIDWKVYCDREGKWYGDNGCDE